MGEAVHSHLPEVSNLESGLWECSNQEVGHSVLLFLLFWLWLPGITSPVTVGNNSLSLAELWRSVQLFMNAEPGRGRGDLNTGMEQLLANRGEGQWVNTPLLSLYSTLRGPEGPQGPEGTEPHLASVESLNPSFLTSEFKLFNLGKLNFGVLNKPVNAHSHLFIPPLTQFFNL